MADEIKPTPAQRALAKVIATQLRAAHNRAAKSLAEITAIGDQPGTDATAVAALAAFVASMQAGE